MSRPLIERRLREVSDHLRELRRDLTIAVEQLAHLSDTADDARLRSLVSETPLAEREHRELESEIDRGERRRDELLARLAADDG